MGKTLSHAHYLLLVIGLVGISSCNKQPKDEFYYYQLTSFSLSNANNSGEAPVPDHDTIPKDSYALELDLDFEVKGGYYGSIPVNEDQVNSFRITCNDTINGIYPNQSLNQFFYFSTGSGVGVPIEESTLFYSDMFSSTMTTQHPSYWGERCFLIMMNPPDEPGVYNFSVYISLSDGRTIHPTITVTLY